MDLIDIRTVTTPEKGSLSFFEAGRDISFDVKRVYYTYGVPEGTQRGGHAHRRLDQLLFCPSGSIEVTLDDGTTRESVVLDSPSKGLVVGNMVWREMTWITPDSVLVVAASEPYDEADYIRSYEQFEEAILETGKGGRHAGTVY